MKRLIFRIDAIDRHRNGVSGEPFHVVLFTDRDGALLVATVFEGPGRVAVLDPALAVEGDVAFGSNSWRGDWFEPELRKAIAAWERKARRGPKLLPLRRARP